MSSTVVSHFRVTWLVFSEKVGGKSLGSHEAGPLHWGHAALWCPSLPSPPHRIPASALSVVHSAHSVCTDGKYLAPGVLTAVPPVTHTRIKEKFHHLWMELLVHGGSTCLALFSMGPCSSKVELMRTPTMTAISAAPHPHACKVAGLSLQRTCSTGSRVVAPVAWFPLSWWWMTSWAFARPYWLFPVLFEESLQIICLVVRACVSGLFTVKLNSLWTYSWYRLLVRYRCLFCPVACLLISLTVFSISYILNLIKAIGWFFMVNTLCLIYEILTNLTVVKIFFYISF